MKNRLIRGFAATVILVALPLMILAEEAVPGENLFAEETFLTESALDEESFSEENFSAVAGFSPDDEEMTPVTDEIGWDDGKVEDRSALVLPGDEDVTATEWWQVAPKLTATVNGNTVTLRLERLKKLPKDVKYYVYEVDRETGAAVQIGKPSNSSKLIMKNRPEGIHEYFARAEMVNIREGKEKYGVSSAHATVEIKDSMLWSKAPVLSVRQENDKDIAVSWTVKEPADKYRLTIKRGKGNAATTETVEVERQSYLDHGASLGIPNSYKVQPLKGGQEGKASSAKTCTLDIESWKVAPVILSAEQWSDKGDFCEFLITFKVAALAEEYIFTGGSYKYTVKNNRLGKVSEGIYSYIYDGKKVGKTNSFRIQPQGVNAREKTVKGKKSAVYKAISSKEESGLGVKSIHVLDEASNLVIEWENNNGSAKTFEARVFNAGTEQKQTVACEPFKYSYRAVFSSLPAGEYAYHVRSIDASGNIIHDDRPVIAKATVQVSGNAVTGITLDQTSATLAPGGTLQLTVTVQPEDAGNKNVTWSSSDESIVTVTSDGLVTAGEKAGTANITVTTVEGSFTATCGITVTNAAVTGVTLDQTSASIALGKTLQLTATVQPENAENKNVTWSSSDESIATVSADGLVTAGNTAGTVTISATSVEGSFTANCLITVYKATVTGISLNCYQYQIELVGGALQLIATVQPEDAENKRVIWSSDDENIATVSADGLVKPGNKAGHTYIKATTEDGSYTASCHVYVRYNSFEVIEVNPRTATFSPGETQQFTATILLEGEENQVVTWESWDERIATVSEDGVVTAGDQSGETIIRAKIVIDEVVYAADCRIAVFNVPYQTFKFGFYEQDNDTENGKEPIEWYALEQDGDNALLLSVCGLYYKKYNEEDTSVTWETCDLRNWLNADFFEDAFSSSEQSAIQKTLVDNSASQCNSEFETEGGNDTQDNVFLLSYSEFLSYFASGQNGICKPTKFALSECTYIGFDVPTCNWWLRSPGYEQNLAYFTGTQFSVSRVNSYYNTIRPVIRVNMNSEVFQAENP